MHTHVIARCRGYGSASALYKSVGMWVMCAAMHTLFKRAHAVIDAGELPTDRRGKALCVPDGWGRQAVDGIESVSFTELFAIFKGPFVLHARWVSEDEKMRNVTKE